MAEKINPEIDMTNFNIFPSSPTAKALADGKTLPRGFTEKYPWRSLECGQSFYIPNENGINGSFVTIQNSCYKWSKKLNRKFRAIKHQDGVEVARLPDVVDFGLEK